MIPFALTVAICLLLTAVLLAEPALLLAVALVAAVIAPLIPIVRWLRRARLPLRTAFLKENDHDHLDQ